MLSCLPGSKATGFSLRSDLSGFCTCLSQSATWPPYGGARKTQECISQMCNRMYYSLVAAVA
jgi:hypothetical protein